MLDQNITRRGFVGGSLVAAAALAAGRRAFAADATPQISLQLYSVRDDCGKDFDGTLDKVAKMGFAGVEFAGYHSYGGKPTELRKRLDDLGLKAAGTHIGTGSFRGDAFQRTVDFHQTIGCKLLMVPGDGDFASPDKSKALADFFTETAAKLKPLGMWCGYHNHTHEFSKDAETGKSYWELFAERTSKDVVLQQDCGWSASAGQDPVALIRKYAGRTLITHFKPAVFGPKKAEQKAYIGQDSVDWVAVLKACREAGATQWVTIEQESYPDGKTPLECVEISLAGLKKIW
ncbi:MAG: sugar phosphate isomerase/epimerase [Armatimonadetes bacterium]|nr:sugar phosphate isomerase/epimerase [Armatimonadota bacterium]